ncbi:hypothetical protein [Paenibacillus pseudetheri]|uniref:Uncharacterized protein n=1 Tax=Paenibacillus pseudetheri TaxID=2897682 RepID=A0ABM9B6T2_9BACL|nr:hypothetical protein [Paenibacillus pseudetheri]CAH1054107.1 hypothetical protein PAECIP111894_00252 [Paenibacillus pseudetheri]
MQAFTVFKNRKEEFLFTINAALPCIIGINSKEASWPEKWLYAWLHCWPWWNDYRPFPNHHTKNDEPECY